MLRTYNNHQFRKNTKFVITNCHKYKNKMKRIFDVHFGTFLIHALRVEEFPTSVPKCVPKLSALTPWYEYHFCTPAEFRNGNLRLNENHFLVFKLISFWTLVVSYLSALITGKVVASNGPFVTSFANRFGCFCNFQ